jgi:hypothetical protein
MHFKKFEYLREFEFIFEKALAPSTAQDGCFYEKTEGRKSRDINFKKSKFETYQSLMSAEQMR